jgi:hypothetical protein
MRRAALKPILLLAIFGVLSSPQSAAAQQAQTVGAAGNQGGATIQTTVIFREKESDCPSGYTIFLGESGGKFPTDPKICYVRTPHPAGK